MKCGILISIQMATFVFQYYINLVQINLILKNKALKSFIYNYCFYSRWNPVLSLESVLVSIMNMLNYPNINSPANIDASVIYLYRINIKVIFKIIIKKLDV